MSLPLERVVSAPPSPSTLSPGSQPARGEPGAGPRFAELFQGLSRRVDTGERLVERALTRDLGGLDAASLIAVQAGIYHYTEAVELAGKLIDRATGAVRTVLQPGS